ncbi:MAG TPA: hypothetical protein PLB97_07190, partial [Accumulibacter sp.]|jgi:hypothetical protein|nr:hypothetical protein [Accumulibacter sp.]
MNGPAARPVRHILSRKSLGNSGKPIIFQTLAIEKPTLPDNARQPISLFSKCFPPLHRFIVSPPIAAPARFG